MQFISGHFETYLNLTIAQYLDFITTFEHYSSLRMHTEGHFYTLCLKFVAIFALRDIIFKLSKFSRLDDVVDHTLTL